MSNLNEFTPIEMQGDAPNRHARRTVESMIAHHVADAMAIEYVAMDRYQSSTEDHGGRRWASLDFAFREYWLIEAKRVVLDWLNREQGTDYHLED